MKSCHRLEPQSALSDLVLSLSGTEMIPRDICAPLCLYLEIHPIWAEGDFEPWQCDNPGAELLLRQSKTRHHIEGGKKKKKLQLKVGICRVCHWDCHWAVRSGCGHETAWERSGRKRAIPWRCSSCRLPRSKFSWIKAQCKSVTELENAKDNKEMGKREPPLDFLNSLWSKSKL